MPILDNVPTVRPEASSRPSQKRQSSSSSRRAPMASVPAHELYQPTVVPSSSSSSRPRPSQQHQSSSRAEPSHRPSQQQQQYQPSTAPQASSRPSRATTTLTTPHDEDMAKRQTKYASLAPQQKVEQDQWAHHQLQMNAGSCPAGFYWNRTDDCGGLNGYLCRGGSHFVTDELLAEGRRRFYIRSMRPGTFREMAWDGPFDAAGIDQYIQQQVQNNREIMRQAIEQRDQRRMQQGWPGMFPGPGGFHGQGPLGPFGP